MGSGPASKPCYLRNMIRLVLLCLLPTSLSAWEFTPGLPCRLTHQSAEAAIELTYDPTQPLYTLTIIRAGPWPRAPQFEMQFDGPRAVRIGTDRHQLSQDMHALRVADAGFGNVLDGLQFNVTATALTGGVRVAFPLDGIASPLAAFRACAPSKPLS